MVERKIHAVQFEPLVQIGERVFLLEPVNRCFEVTLIEPLPCRDVDFGAIAAGGTSAEREMTEIYMPDNELGQYRFVPITSGVKVVGHWSPRGARMYSTAEQVFEIPDIGDYADEHVAGLQATEFYQWQDRKRYMQLYSKSAVSASIVRFYGYALRLREVPTEKPYLSVPIRARTAESG